MKLNLNQETQTKTTQNGSYLCNLRNYIKYMGFENNSLYNNIIYEEAEDMFDLYQINYPENFVTAFTKVSRILMYALIQILIVMALTRFLLFGTNPLYTFIDFISFLISDNQLPEANQEDVRMHIVENTTIE